MAPLLRSRLPGQDSDHCVMRDGENIGRMYQHHDGPRKGQWSWFIMREFQIRGRPTTGTENTLEQAKAAFKAAVSEGT